MEKVLGHTRKVLASDKGNSLMVLPLDQMLRGQGTDANKADGNKDTSLIRLNPPSSANSSQEPGASNTNTSSTSGSIMDQRRANAQRDTSTRVGRE